MLTSEVPLTAGQAAELTGTTRKGLRLYEQRGLLNSPARNSAGYRLYSEDDVSTLRFIRQAQTLGLTLEEINQILSLHRDGTEPCASVRDFLAEHLRHIEEQITHLTRMREAIRAASRADEASASNSATLAAFCSVIEGAPIASPSVTT
ncbi:heavy metal-responsive transcriptional regulator [Leifsonia sp. L25]|uniref:heavy metal-responsive transcriptional regulator n=1 Tax=Actinomycetes TaxID=1760 RepID=UPI003D68B70F